MPHFPGRRSRRTHNVPRPASSVHFSEFLHTGSSPQAHHSGNWNKASIHYLGPSNCYHKFLFLFIIWYLVTSSSFSCFFFSSWFSPALSFFFSFIIRMLRCFFFSFSLHHLFNWMMSDCFFWVYIWSALGYFHPFLDLFLVFISVLNYYHLIIVLNMSFFWARIHFISISFFIF